MVYNFNRLFIGTLIVLTILVSYFFNLDILLFFILVLLIFFDFNKSILSSYLGNITLFIFFVIMLFTTLFIENSIFLILPFSFTLIAFSIIFQKFYRYFFMLFIINILTLISILYQIDRNIIYLVIIISFINDTFAYIFGSYLKGPLITPIISPKKTWSGTLISFFISTIILINLNFNILIASLMSISLFIGDIYFSFIKRKLKIKDFSNTLASHGGILDRIDSITFILLVFGLVNL